MVLYSFFGYFMLKKFCVSLFLLILVVIAAGGCINSIATDPLVGTWHCSSGMTTLGDTIVINSDGTFTCPSPGLTYTGTWSKSGDTYTLTLNTAMQFGSMIVNSPAVPFNGIIKNSQFYINCGFLTYIYTKEVPIATSSPTNAPPQTHSTNDIIVGKYIYAPPGVGPQSSNGVLFDQYTIFYNDGRVEVQEVGHDDGHVICSVWGNWKKVANNQYEITLSIAPGKSVIQTYDPSSQMIDNTWKRVQ
jgi:hypothetical protein